jgi:hypothetical protein
MCRESIVPILVCTYSWSAFSQQTAYHLGSDQPILEELCTKKRKLTILESWLFVISFSNFGSEVWHIGDKDSDLIKYKHIFICVAIIVCPTRVYCLTPSCYICVAIIVFLPRLTALHPVVGPTQVTKKWSNYQNPESHVLTTQQKWVLIFEFYQHIYGFVVCKKKNSCCPY